MNLRTTSVALLASMTATALAAGVIGGVDTRIGTDTDGREAEFQAAGGDYVALIRWNDALSLFVSDDSGATWFRGIKINASQGFASADMAIGSGYIYVAYTTNQISTEVKIRRFFLATGLPDLTYGDAPPSNLRLLYDSAPQSIASVALETDVDSSDSEIYAALHLSDGTSRFLSDDSSDGTSFSESTWDVAGAAGEFDLHWNFEFDIYSLFLSYIDQDDRVQVWRYDGVWSQATSFPFSGSQPRTSISAIADQVVVAYQASATNGQGVGYRSSLDGGTTWGAFTMIDAPVSGEGDLSDVDITAQGGLGFAVVYNQDSGATSPTYFRSKPGYLPGPWTDRRSFNDFAASPGRFPSIDWLPSDDYGAVYIGGVSEAAYFDSVSPFGIFLDGFESGDSSLWDATVSTP